MAVNIFVQTKIDASKHSAILTDQIDALLDFVWYEKDTTWKDFKWFLAMHCGIPGYAGIPWYVV